MTEPEPTGSVRAIYEGPWRIDLTDRPGVARLLPWRVLARLAAAALVAARAPKPASIGLILAGDAELAALNARHLGKAGPTDVLSFPLLSPAAFPPRPGRTRPDVLVAPGARPSGPDFVLPPGRRIHLGDIIVSVERAVEQARAGRGGQTGDVHWSAADELRLLVVHGTLHVCGWDHAEPADERAMRALEQHLLAGER